MQWAFKWGSQPRSRTAIAQFAPLRFLDHWTAQNAGLISVALAVYLLDTNIASHGIRGDIPGVRERLASVPMQSVAVSVITQAELLYGVGKRGHPRGLATRVHEFLIRVEVLPWTQAVAGVHGDLRASCEAAGVTLAPMDMMIAAHAKTVGAILVTMDRAFDFVPAVLGGLDTEDLATMKRLSSNRTRSRPELAARRARDARTRAHSFPR